MKRLFIASHIGRSGLLVAVLILTGGMGVTTREAPLRDIATREGPRTTHLVGYGIVVGLNGSGDRTVSAIRPADARELTTLGFNESEVEAEVEVTSGDAVEVLVTASLPRFAARGDRFDVEVHAVGDARSLQGGQLLMVSLLGPDGKAHAYAHGKLTDASDASPATGSPLRAVIAEGGVLIQNRTIATLVR